MVRNVPPVVAETEELRKRIAAAAAYKGISVDDLGKEIGLSKSTFYRRLKELTEPRRRGPFLILVAEACDLKPEFFTVDFDRLPELANGGQQDEAAQTRVDEVRADLEILAAEVQQRIASIEQTIRGLGQQGQP